MQQSSLALYVNKIYFIIFYLYIYIRKITNCGKTDGGGSTGCASPFLLFGFLVIWLFIFCFLGFFEKKLDDAAKVLLFHQIAKNRLAEFRKNLLRKVGFCVNKTNSL